jgi:hypothetical protein
MSAEPVQPALWDSCPDPELDPWRPVHIPRRKEPPVLRYLEPHEVKVYRYGGRVHCTIADEVTLLDPRFLRAHPLTDPDRYLAIREADAARGQEYGLLRRWRELDRESRDIVRAELARRYLSPVLRRILSAEDYGGVYFCQFDTDRGMRSVTLRDIRDNVVYMGTRLLITDAEGNRYDIPDLSQLDPKSAMLLARIL